MKTLSHSPTVRCISSLKSKYWMSASASCFGDEEYSWRGGRETFGSGLSPKYPGMSPDHFSPESVTCMHWELPCSHAGLFSSCLFISALHVLFSTLIKLCPHWNYLLQMVRSWFSTTEHLQCDRSWAVCIWIKCVCGWANPRACIPYMSCVCWRGEATTPGPQRSEGCREEGSASNLPGPSLSLCI